MRRRSDLPCYRQRFPQPDDSQTFARLTRVNFQRGKGKTNAREVIAGIGGSTTCLTGRLGTVGTCRGFRAIGTRRDFGPIRTRGDLGTIGTRRRLGTIGALGSLRALRARLGLAPTGVAQSKSLLPGRLFLAPRGLTRPVLEQSGTRVLQSLVIRIPGQILAHTLDGSIHRLPRWIREHDPRTHNHRHTDHADKFVLHDKSSLASLPCWIDTSLGRENQRGTKAHSRGARSPPLSARSDSTTAAGETRR